MQLHWWLAYFLAFKGSDGCVKLDKQSWEFPQECTGNDFRVFSPITIASILHSGINGLHWSRTLLPWKQISYAYTVLVRMCSTRNGWKLSNSGAGGLIRLCLVSLVPLHFLCNILHTGTVLLMKRKETRCYVNFTLIIFHYVDMRSNTSNSYHMHNKIYPSM